MFITWKIGNFKAIRDIETLDLAPLTIFSGINSSGKSSLIQSILLVSQSFASVVDDEALVLNGRFLQLGRLVDVLHMGDVSKPLVIGFDWLPPEQALNPGSLFIHLDAEVKGVNSQFEAQRAERLIPQLEWSRLAFRYARQNRGAGRPLEKLETRHVRSSPHLRSSRLPQSLRRQIETGAYDYVITEPRPGNLTQNVQESVERAGLTNLVPTRLLVGVDEESRHLVEDAQWIIAVMEQRWAVQDDTRPQLATMRLSPGITPLFRELRDQLFEDSTAASKRPAGRFIHAVISEQGRFSRDNLVSLIDVHLFDRNEREMFGKALSVALVTHLSKPVKQTTSKGAPITYEERLLPPQYLAPVDELGRIMRDQIYFLGPLRDEPRVIYGSPPQAERWSVGLKGEFTAAMLDDSRNLIVRYPEPPGDEFHGQFAIHEGRLIDAVTIWLQRMGLADAIDTEEAPKIGYRLTINSPGMDLPLDLTSVGVGVSQILPTLVQALVAPVDSVLIFEQPELHLHPKVQSVLADFFIGVTQLGKQCLVETHSEYLINRVRRRIVESDHDTVLPNLRIYFAERKGSATSFRKVEPNEFGAIVDWPEGFFDQSEQEASIMLRTQIDKRRAAKADQPTRSDRPAG